MRTTCLLACAVLGSVSVAHAQVVPPPQQEPQQPQQPPAPPYYPPQPQPYYPQPYPYGYAPQPYPQPPPGPPPKSHFHDGEVIGDFTIIGTLAAIDVIVRQELDANTGTFVLLAGVFGGGATGYLLTQLYDVDSGGAQVTTLGLAVGTANAALLIRPAQTYDADQVLSLLVAGSALGAVGGFIYGQEFALTPGQATFISNTTMLGSATAAFAAIIGSRNGKFDSWESGSLAAGMNGGVATGLVLAPKLDWSPARAKMVFATTMLGALAGGFIASLATSKKTNLDGSTSHDYNPDVICTAMAGGMWAGFGLAIAATHDAAPDPSQVKAKAATAPPVTIVPWVGHDDSIGLATAGTF